tara:strand:+ start:2794 stop:3378 length:585 start_codon:yes stop_codon:yes gene_type:complete
MAITAIDVTIASRALNLIGANQISSFTEGSTEANVANNLYDAIVEGSLTLTRWRFASGQQQLSRLDAVPTSRWDAAYQMPTSPPILLLHGVTVLSKPITYDRYEDKIYTNTSVDDLVIADYSYRPDSQYWPAYFSKALMYELASVFASSITRKGDLAAHWATEAQREYTRAKWADSSSQTARRLRTSTLTAIRR